MDPLNVFSGINKMIQHKQDHPWDMETHQLFQEYINAPIFQVRQVQTIIPELTNKKVIDWDKAFSLSLNRTNDKKQGWRLLSLEGLVKLSIIAGLRRFRLDTPFIADVLKKADTLDFFLNEPDRIKSIATRQSSLAGNIKSCLQGPKLLLVVSSFGKVLFVDRKKRNKIFKLAEGEQFQITTLPFYEYVQKAIELLGEFRPVEIRKVFTEAESIFFTFLKKSELKKVGIICPEKKMEFVFGDNKIRNRRHLADIASLLKSGQYETVKATRSNGKVLTFTSEEAEP